ncbi:MAG: hypothetical protein GX640_16170 [Fibrobacter sp.]|nr:hypothetical protein [Fibrobacter sp.]
MKSSVFCVIILCLIFQVSAQKKVYIPNFIKNMNLNSTSSQWCYERSKETDNVVVFWESGFGSDPSTASGSYRVDMNKLLSVAEKTYSIYLDSLKFVIRGSSVSDKYKLMIFLLYSTEWAAYGSGQDNLVGSLHINPAAANIGTVVAHEMGHCFEYLTGCDTDGGYQYGFGENGSGGNGFWEQCAQWMAWQVYPGQQFLETDFRNYLNLHHKHVLHETMRYASYFIQDYWTYKHGITFTGKLWRDSRKPEDPIETYRRLNSLSQSQFNDEIYEQASHLTTWDFQRIKTFGERYIDSRSQPKMNLTSDEYWIIDKSVCPENYGYNCIKLNVPLQATTVSVQFKGKAGASGFRVLNTDKGGWRFGFVALLKDGTRKYSDMATANVVNGKNPDTTLTFNCPANCSKLWMVVSGAPQEHWRHPWDDNDNNDEQWPYQVKFKNTNLLGQKVSAAAPTIKSGLSHVSYKVIQSTMYLSKTCSWHMTNLAGKSLVSGFGKEIDLKNLSRGSYIVSFGDKHLKIVRD